jgi:endonuclease/exonuclease/phosphatase (EEP) superfamily protein YafD
VELRTLRPIRVGLGADRTLPLVVLALANVGLLAVVSGWAGPVSDIIAPFAGHLIGFGLAASLAVLFRPRMLALMAAGVAVTALLHAGLGLARCCGGGLESSPVALTTGDASGQSLTVLSLNTWQDRGDASRLADYLASAPADVVVLSEFDSSNQALLEQLSSVYPHRVACTSEIACSLAVLSRVPFDGSGAGRIAEGNPAFLWARLESGSQGATTIIATNLSDPTRDPWLHDRQMRELARFVRRIDGPLVLAGDLNTSPWSSSFRTLRRVASLVPANRLLPTWPAWPIALPQVALDHIFASQDFTVADSGTGPAVGSDHLPVWAKLERPPLAAYRRGGQSGRSRLAAARLHFGGQFLGDLGREDGGTRNLP